MHLYMNHVYLFRTSVAGDKGNWITSTKWFKWTVVIKVALAVNSTSVKPRPREGHTTISRVHY